MVGRADLACLGDITYQFIKHRPAALGDQVFVFLRADQCDDALSKARHRFLVELDRLSQSSLQCKRIYLSGIVEFHMLTPSSNDVKFTPTDELPEQGIGWYKRVGDGIHMLQEPQQPAGRLIGRTC